MISWTYVFPGDFFKEKISSLLIAYSMAPGTWKEILQRITAKKKLPDKRQRKDFGPTNKVKKKI